MIQIRYFVAKNLVRVLLFVFSLGFFIGTFFYENSFDEVKITDFFISIGTVGALLFAIVSNNKISKLKLETKKYEIKEEYINCLKQIDIAHRKLHATILSLIPALGKLIYDKKFYHNIIMNLYDRNENYVDSALELDDAQEFFNFYKVELNEEFKKDHVRIFELSGDLHDIASCIAKQIELHYIDEKVSSSELKNQSTMFLEKSEEITVIFKKIKSSNFIDIFKEE